MEELILSIYATPQDWKIKTHTFVYKDKFQLWIANGFSFCKPYESGMNMTFVQKCKIWKAYKWWCSNAPIESVR